MRSRMEQVASIMALATPAAYRARVTKLITED